MADTYEKDLAQKSSLTTRDYIRVVGSDNVSYKQGVSNVAETFAQALPRYSAVTSLKDWAAATNGRGITITNSTTIDTPSQTSNKYGVAWTNSFSDGTNPWANLFWSPTGSTDIYMCQKTNTSAWSDWVKMPTREEIDNAHRYKGSISVDDFNSITETGIYFARGKSTTLNPPIPSIPGRYYQLLVTNTDGVVTQFATSHNDPNTIYSRDFVSSTWSAWVKQPTRKEVTAVTPLNLGNTVDSMLSALQSVWDSGGIIVLFTCGAGLTNILTKEQASVSGKGVVALLGDPSGATTNIDFLLYTGTMELFTARYSTGSSSIVIAKKATMTNL